MKPSDMIVDIEPPADGVLSASLTPSFDYTRSTGPVLGAFFTGLRDRRVVGSRDSAGTVHVPPIEFDPHTREAVTELVDIGSGEGIGGVVVVWTWVPEPTDVNPLTSPFAWALVRLDGADTALLLPLAADGPDAVHSGMRVEIRWAADRVGSIHDVECVVPAGHDDDDAAATSAPTDAVAPDATAATPDASAAAPDTEPVTGIVTPIGLAVEHTAGPAESVFLRNIVRGRILGRRRSNAPEVYVPPRDYCPSDGVAMGEYVEVADHGTVTTFGIVNVPFAGQQITPPYVTAYIMLDGADVPVQHLVLGCEASEVHIGMRVRAVWAPEGERPESMKAITHFEPSGEPDGQPGGEPGSEPGSDPDSHARHL